ncbi:PID-CTERM protein-sorting domain-containing protein [Yeosuana marina]|uniref:PID-CTERM protein-sorting domain-containing protein n=1 Tax=Yeosuana marina TaxID=1565536 RepID=UPI0030C81C8C
MTAQNKKIVASILFVLISCVCMAQVDPPPSPVMAKTNTPPPGFLPIDGGVLLGLCIGLFYGAKKILANK